MAAARMRASMPWAPSRTRPPRFDSMLDRAKVMPLAPGTDRPHVLRQAINNCRNFGIVSIIGVYGGFVDKVPMGSAINRGLTFKMAQTPVQHYLPSLMKRIENGEIDPSFVITHKAKLVRWARHVQDVPRQAGRLHQGRAHPLIASKKEVSSMATSNPVRSPSSREPAAGIGYELTKAVHQPAATT